jgi:hypothetical protein
VTCYSARHFNVTLKGGGNSQTYILAPFDRGRFNDASISAR